MLAKVTAPPRYPDAGSDVDDDFGDDDAETLAKKRKRPDEGDADKPQSEGAASPFGQTSASGDEPQAFKRARALVDNAATATVTADGANDPSTTTSDA